MLNLVVGDPHTTPEELADCEALFDLVEKAGAEYGADMVTCLGDQHNTHDAVSTRVIELYVRRFRRLRAAGHKVAALVGNHDMCSPTQQYPHAMLAYPDITVVESPRLVLCGDSGFAAMPYYPDPAFFLVDARRLFEEHGDLPLFCHQTFAGAAFENGWKPDGAVDANDVPFTRIFSGHIHTPQVVSGKVTYVGAPRWRTRADAGTERALLLLEHGPDGVAVRARIDTGLACRRIHCFEDSADTPLDLAARLDHAALLKDRIYVDIRGTAAYVRAREAELKARGARTRTFPDREVRQVVSEAEGIERGFQRFGRDFRAPYGTETGSLLSEAGRRLGITA